MSIEGLEVSKCLPKVIFELAYFLLHVVRGSFTLVGLVKTKTVKCSELPISEPIIKDPNHSKGVMTGEAATKNYLYDFLPARPPSLLNRDFTLEESD